LLSAGRNEKSIFGHFVLILQRLPLLDERLRHKHVAWSLDELKIMLLVLSHDFLGRASHLLKVEEHFRVGWLDAQTGICRDAVLLDLASLDHLLAKFKGSRQFIKEYIVRVVGALRLVRVLQIKHV